MFALWSKDSFPVFLGAALRLSDTCNQHGAVAKVVVGHVVDIRVCCQQFGAVVEPTRTASEPGSAERYAGTHAKSFLRTFRAGDP
jgi:hypothetical protein